VKKALIDCYDDEFGQGLPYAEVACGASNALAEFILHLSANRHEAELTKRKFLKAIEKTCERIIEQMSKRGDFDEPSA
jgi:hypothetical protein